jgi:hypothetical protein
MLVLTVCGLWHGANWPMTLSFSIIGVFMSIRYLWQAVIIRNIRPSNTYKLLQKVPDGVHIILTFIILVYGFMLFRVDGTVRELDRAGIEIPWWEIARQLYTKIMYLGEANYLTELIYHKGITNFIIAVGGVFILFLAEGLVKDTPIEQIVLKKSKLFRWSTYSFMLLCVFWFGVYGSREFFYFQF